jgi:hypothetical protein
MLSVISFVEGPDSGEERADLAIALDRIGLELSPKLRADFQL